jgi:HD-GYP domain-containing protein (c-di-GMP phosphodiesterase class II)/DNA-binding CsgD family transcriptional regulator
MAAPSTLRLVEVLAALSLSTDLATGQPLEHGLRRTLLATWLAVESGLKDDELRDAYYVALLGSVGCVLDSAALASFVEDDITFRADMFTLDMADPLVAARYFGRTVGRGHGAVRRVGRLIGLARQSVAICRDVAVGVGGILDLGPQVRQALGECDEHWNGKGAVLGLKGEQISVYARLFLLAQDVEVFYRIGGTQAAVSVVERRSGTYYDPRLASLFAAHAVEFLSRSEVASTWDAVLGAEPAPARMLDDADFDTVAHQVANFIDIRSAYTVGHSPAVAALAEGAAHRLGLGPADALTLREAGLLHDLGRAGVPVALWDKVDPLTASERARLQRHPGLTELVLARSSGLGHLGTLAGLHHERLDGSGYRGVSAASLPITARVLATADTYQSKVERRPYRAPLTPAAAAAHVRREADAGRLDGDAVRAVLEVAGQAERVAYREFPSGLTSREVDVLRLVVRGMSNREIAVALFLAQKTVGHHVERIYHKIGVSTRVGATIFAIQSGLATMPDGSIR